MVEINNTTKHKINIKKIEQIVQEFLVLNNKPEKQVSVALVGDQEIQELNEQYRKKNRVTDVLSFAGEGDTLGEVIICYSQIKRQAKEYSNSIEEELVFILVHGLLHLLGHEDKTEKGRKEMERKGREFISSIKNL